MLGSEASVDGVKIPVPTPATRARRSVGTKPSTNTIAPNAPARIRSDVTMHHLRDQRSAAAPKTGPSSMAGATSARSTRPMAHGDSKRS